MTLPFFVLCIKALKFAFEWKRFSRAFTDVMQTNS